VGTNGERTNRNRCDKIHGVQYIAGVPNLWPAGKMWPARPLEVALDLSTNKNKIYMKNCKIDIFTGYTEIQLIRCSKLK